MRVLFCKIGYMKYYKGVCKTDSIQNGGSFVTENGYGHEQYNFEPMKFEGQDEACCLGFVETKATNGKTVNQLHIEKINGCELLKNEDCAENVLVIWCAVTDIKDSYNRNETVIVGWYKNAEVYRNYLSCDFGNDYIQNYNVIAKTADCVLLPYNSRRRWTAPAAKYKSYGFGQSLIWYASEENSQGYVAETIEKINNYNGANDLNVYPPKK